MPILRGTRYVDEAYVIGEDDPVAANAPAYHRPPPPLPPPVAIEIEQAASEAIWSTPRWHSESEETAPVDPGPHPLEEVVQARLAEAEHMLTQAQDEAEGMLAEARRQAAELGEEAAAEIERARVEGESLKAAAELEVERIRDEAQAAGHLAGYDAGHAEGLAKADKETADRIGHVTRLAISAAVDRRELLHNAEAEVVRLATRIARKVVQSELALDPRLVQRMAETALRHVAADGLVKLHVNPEDHAELRDYWLRSHGTQEGDRTFEVVADDTIGRGGIVIETRAGTIDARLETQLDEIAQALGVDGEEAPMPEPAALTAV